MCTITPFLRSIKRSLRRRRWSFCVRVCVYVCVCVFVCVCVTCFLSCVVCVTCFSCYLRYEPAGGRLRLVVITDGEDTLSPREYNGVKVNALG